MGKTAVLVIDMLNDFVKKEYGSSAIAGGALEIVANIRKLVDSAIKNGVPLIYCSDAHLKSDHELARWGEHAMRGSAGCKIISELPTEGAVTFERGEDVTVTESKLSDAKNHKVFDVEKGTYDAFYDTPLDALLKRLGIDALYIAGVDTNICDLHTSSGAFFRGYKITIVSDGVNASTPEEYKRGLKNLEFLYAAKLKSTNECLHDFAKA